MKRKKNLSRCESSPPYHYPCWHVGVQLLGASSESNAAGFLSCETHVCRAGLRRRHAQGCARQGCGP